MNARTALQRLAIPVPTPELNSSTAPLGRLLAGLTADLAAATRAALSGGGQASDDLIAAIDRAAIWPPMAAGVVIAAEVLAHLADQRRACLPHRQLTDPPAPSIPPI